MRSRRALSRGSIECAIRGTFEAHLTIETDHAADFDALCGRLGVKHVAIELADGVHRSQPMTASYHRGELPAVIAEVDALYAQLVAAGFAVVRVKLEALASNDGIDDAVGGYFEFHVKVRDPDLAQLAPICERHHARLSRNARSAATRFITMRVYGAARAAAEAKLDALLAELAAGDHHVAGTAREYTVYDSRIELDAGWLEPPR